MPPESYCLNILFYFTPVDMVLDSLSNGRDFLMENVAKIGRFIYKQHSEVVLCQMMKKCSEDLIQSGVEGKIKDTEILKLLGVLADSCLTFDGEPKVFFDKLLRWQFTSRLLGQDVLIAAYMAQNAPNSNLLYPDVLGVHESLIDSVLKEGLCDVHAHFGATSNFSDINWIYLMNNPIELAKSVEQKVSYYQVPTALLTKEQKAHSLSYLSYLAAVIRRKMYLFLVKGVSLDKSIAEICDLENTKELEIFFHQYDDTASDLLDYSLDAPNIINNGFAEDNYFLFSPFAILQGERNLLFRFFQLYYDANVNTEELAKWMYAYLVIKNTIRREFVQLNDLWGFDNFLCYQNRKFLTNEKRYRKLLSNYALLSSVVHSGDVVEFRCSNTKKNLTIFLIMEIEFLL